MGFSHYSMVGAGEAGQEEIAFGLIFMLGFRIIHYELTGEDT